MTLPLNRDVLRAAYDFLSETEPFAKWNLPPGEDVIFSIARDTETRGLYWHKNKRHHIAISSGCVKRTNALIEAMAHEMVHLHEKQTGVGRRSEHGAAFKSWAAQVCRIHGFDLGLF